MNEVLFHERQGFEKYLIVIVVLLSLLSWGLLLFVGYQQFCNGVVFGKCPADVKAFSWAVLFVGLFTLAIIGFVVLSRVELKITSTTIYYRFFPLQIRFREIPWTEIVKVYLRPYRAFREFGGYGLRLTVRSGQAYIMSGFWGLQIETRKGRKILIGTQQRNKVRALLQQLGRL